MNLQLTRLGIVAAVMMAAMGLHAQTERSDDFKAKYEQKEVVVMSRHNIRSPLTSGGAAYTLSSPPTGLSSEEHEVVIRPQVRMAASIHNKFFFISS